MHAEDDKHWPVANGRRGSRREARKKGRLRWLCNPLVLRTIIALARLFYELARIVWRH